MKKYIVLSFFTLALIFTINAQNSNQKTSEVGIQLGVANYLGDLSQSSSPSIFGNFQVKAFRPAAGFYYRSNFHRFLSFRTGIAVGQVYGNDNFSKPGTGRYERNLHFKSNIVDAQLMLEWNILPYQIGHYKYKFAPYIGIGVGGFYFNPRAELNGNWVNLQALGTEGQGLAEYPNRSKYSKMQFNIPASIGFKWNIGRQFALGAEFQYKLTFTDYIDDVSTVYPNFDYYPNNYIQAISDEAIALSYRGDDPDISKYVEQSRGDSQNNDAYFFIMLNLSYKIGQFKSAKCGTYRR